MNDKKKSTVAIGEFVDFESSLLEADALGEFERIEALRCALEAKDAPKAGYHWQAYYLAFSGILLCEAEINPLDNIEKAVAALRNAHGSAEQAAEFYAIAALAHSHFAAALLNPFGKAKMGLRYENAIRCAYEADDKNPRVLYVEAISVFHKPRMVGGNKKKALTLLYEAAECFDAHEKRFGGQLKLPNWGLCEIWYAIGKACLHFNDFDQVAEAVDKIEAEKPGHRKAKALHARLNKKINRD